MTTTPKIFVSYRRDDSPGSAGRLYDRLADTFPRDALFMDVDTMVPGVDFVQELDEAVLGCDVLLALIGRSWLSTTSPDGKRRIDSAEDFVRIEITTALQNGIRVIPVLVDGAQMPVADDLPDELKPLARRHAIELSHLRFASDAERLAHSLLHSSNTAQATSDIARTAKAAEPDAAPAMPGVSQTRQLSRARIFGAAFTVFAFISSAALAQFYTPSGTTYWLERAGIATFIWAGTNVMAGPAIALKLWLPRFTMAHMWGVMGATFAALAAMLGSQQLLMTFFFPTIPADAAGARENIINLGLREIPISLVAGIALGYFLSQALGSWFASRGGPGFVRRMVIIWTVTGTTYAIANFLLITILEAMAASGAGTEEAALLARADARMWSDTLLYGSAWALGFALTFSFAARRSVP